MGDFIERQLPVNSDYIQIQIIWISEGLLGTAFRLGGNTVFETHQPSLSVCARVDLQKEGEVLAQILVSGHQMR